MWLRQRSATAAHIRISPVTATNTHKSKGVCLGYHYRNTSCTSMRIIASRMRNRTPWHRAHKKYKECDSEEKQPVVSVFVALLLRTVGFIAGVRPA